jgi:hypothetical protein
MKKLSVVVFVLAFALMALMPVVATTISITSFKTAVYRGQSEVSADFAGTGQPQNGTLGWGTGAFARNNTYYFNLSDYSGLTISNIRMKTYFANAQGANANGEARMHLAQADNHTYQELFDFRSESNLNTNTSAGKANVTGSDMVWNGSFYDFNFSYAVTQLYVAATFAPNGSVAAGTAFQLVSTAAAPYNRWAVLEFDSDSVSGSGVPVSSYASYMPIDGQPNNTVASTALLARLSALRNDGATYTLQNSVKKNVDNSAGSAQLLYAALLNSSTFVYPVQPVVFMQANDTFYVSPPLTLAGSKFVAAGKFDRVFYSAGVTTATGTKSPLYFQYHEINSDPAGGKAINCYYNFERYSGSTTQARMISICTAPDGLSAGNERVFLRDAANNTLATIYNGADKISEYAITIGSGYNFYYSLPSRTANETVNAVLSGIGQSGIVVFQQTNGTAIISYAGTDSAGSNMLFGTGSANIFAAAINAYSAAPIFSQNIIKAYALADYSTDAYLSAFGTGNTGLAITSVLLSPPTGFTQSFQKGITHVSVPTSAPSLSFTCPTSVTMQAGISWPITCTNLQFSASVSQYQSPVSNTGVQTATFQDYNGSIYRSISTDAGSITSLTVQDLNGAILPSALSATEFSILRQQATQNTTKYYRINFVDASGITYTSYAVVNIVIGSVTGSSPSGHHVVLLSFDRNSSGLYALPNVTLNISGAVCTTQLTNVSVPVGNSTVGQTFAKCDLYVPNSLSGAQTNYSNSYYNVGFNNTFWGAYSDASVAPLGIASGAYGSVLYFTNDTANARAYVALDAGTCLAPEVIRRTSNENEYCGTVSCPITDTVTKVGAYSVTAQAFTCTQPDEQKCFIDPVSKIGYKITCGNVCQLITTQCGGNQCNSDFSGCADDAAGTGTSGEYDFIADNPLFKWGIANINFVIGTVLVLAAAFYAQMRLGQHGTQFALIIAFAGMLGVAIITLPAAAAILGVAAVLAAIAGAFFVFKGG